MFWRKKPKKTFAPLLPEAPPAGLADGIARLDELARKLGAPPAVHPGVPPLVLNGADVKTAPDTMWERNFAAQRILAKEAPVLPRQFSGLREQAALHVFSLHKDRSVAVTRIAAPTFDLPEQASVLEPIGAQLAKMAGTRASKPKRSWLARFLLAR